MLDYLTLKPAVFGIDISDLSLKIIKLKKKQNMLALSSFGQTEIKTGLIKNGEIINEDALVQAVKESLGRVKGSELKTRYAVVSLPEEKAFLQVIQMPLMQESELMRAVYFEAENYIPMPIDSVYLDAQIVKPVVDHLDHIDVLIAALPKKIVDSYLSVLEKAGLKVLALEIESQAIARALIKEGVSLEPVAIVDIGALRGSFIIFSGYAPRFTTSLEVSSEKFTEKISAGLKISLKEAELIKCKHGIEGRKGKDVLKIIKPELQDLVDQIQRCLDYYKTHASHEHLGPGAGELKKIILCGGVANLKGLCDFLSKELSLRVEPGNPWSNILPNPIKEVPELSYAESLEYTTALGLALRGINA